MNPLSFIQSAMRWGQPCSVTGLLRLPLLKAARPPRASRPDPNASVVAERLRQLASDGVAGCSPKIPSCLRGLRMADTAPREEVGAVAHVERIGLAPANELQIADFGFHRLTSWTALRIGSSDIGCFRRTPVRRYGNEKAPEAFASGVFDQGGAALLRSPDTPSAPKRERKMGRRSTDRPTRGLLSGPWAARPYRRRRRSCRGAARCGGAGCIWPCGRCGSGSRS